MPDVHYAGVSPRSIHRPGPGARRALLGMLMAWPMLFAAPCRAGDAGRPPHPHRMRGKVSWYGRRFAGRPTASGEPFDPDALTMAHPSWPFGAIVRVTHLRNRRSVVVRVNDRGPQVRGRVADLSLAAARALGMLRAGVAEARLELLEPTRP